jgi:sialate O-acetylesterase
VTIDIGDATNLHPTNKREVGRRLAIAARRLVYGERITSSGPVASSVTRRGQNIVVQFRNVTGTLSLRSSTSSGFELCGTTQSSCRWAEARVDRASVVLASRDNKAEPTRVRYAWGESPVYAVFDDSGLPAGPFEEAVR